MRRYLILLVHKLDSDKDAGLSEEPPTGNGMEENNKNTGMIEAQTIVLAMAEWIKSKKNVLQEEVWRGRRQN